MSQAVTIIDSQEQTQVNDINQRLQSERTKGAHVLAPMTLQTIPPMHRPVVVSVQIDPDPNSKEVYKQRGGGLSLSAIAFKKLGDAIGIQWVPEECGRTDDGKDPDYVCYRMTGLVKALDGTWRKIIGDKEIRMSVIIEELTDSYREKAQKYLHDPKDGPDFCKSYPDPEVWIAEKVRQDALQMRKHMLARAQSGALARATKALGIRETYTLEELKKPFVFPKLVFSPDPNHPQDRAFLLAQGAGAINQLYKPETPQSATLAQPAMNALPAPHEVAFLAPPDDQQRAMSNAPTPEEILRGDFLSASPTEQVEILKEMIKRKGYTGKISGELDKWTTQNRQSFFDRLLTMADVVTGKPALPFE